MSTLVSRLICHVLNIGWSEESSEGLDVGEQKLKLTSIGLSIWGRD